jgi:hypothetical protein
VIALVETVVFARVGVGALWLLAVPIPLALAAGWLRDRWPRSVRRVRRVRR